MRVLGDAPPGPNRVCAHLPGAASTRPIDGWVSLSWIATFSGKQSKLSVSQVKADNVMQGTSNKEVLLLEAEFRP